MFRFRDPSGAVVSALGTGVAIGQGVQVAGALTALIAGVIATRADYRKQARASR